MGMGMNHWNGIEKYIPAHLYMECDRQTQTLRVAIKFSSQGYRSNVRVKCDLFYSASTM